MRNILLLWLMASVMYTPSASAQASAKAHLMNRAEFELFLHDLDRESARWTNVVSEVDVSSLKDLPYKKGEIMDRDKESLRTGLLAVRDDISNLRKSASLTSQVDMLVQLEEAKSSMADLINHLDVEKVEDMDKFSKWSNDALSAYSEMGEATVKFYGYLSELSQRIDRQIDVAKIH